MQIQTVSHTTGYESARNQVQQEFDVTVYHDFTEAESVWRQFQQTASHYSFQSFDWLACWYNTLGRAEKLSPCIVTVSTPELGTVMVLPFAINTGGFIRHLSWMGGDLSSYHAPLIHPEFAEFMDEKNFYQIWTTVLKALSGIDAVLLVSQPETIQQLENPFKFIWCTEHPSNSYEMTLPEQVSISDFLRSKKNKKSRSKLLNRQKNLAKLGQLSFEVIADQEEAEQVLKEMIAQKKETLQEMGAADPFQRAGYTEFVETMTSRFAGTNTLVNFSVLRLDDRVIATHWGLNYKNTFYSIFPTYDNDPALNKYSVGTVLLVDLFEWCLENGIKVFDFGVGDHDYKLRWKDNDLPLFISAQSLTLKGALYLYPVLSFIKIKHWIKHHEKLYPLFLGIRKFLKFK